MNKKKFTLLFVLLPILVFSQTDTVLYSTEQKTREKLTKNKWYAKYFLKEEAPVKRFWKMNFSDYMKGRPSIALETRFSDQSTLLFDVNVDISGVLGKNVYYRYEEDWYVMGEHLFNIALNTSVEYSNYITLNRREKKGLYVQGFSASYVAFGVHGTFNSANEIVTIEGAEFAVLQNGDDPVRTDKEGFKLLALDPVINGHYLEATFKYGIHRRIGNIGYVDAFAGLGLGKSNLFDFIYLKPLLGFEIGFAFAKYK